jgi:hypothetical protein
VDVGLELDEIDEIEKATKEPIDLAAIDRESLTKHDRLFVYAIACWIAQLDGITTDEEAFMLSRLGDALGVPERPRVTAEALAKEIAALPEGDRPARYDLTKLYATIGERLAP